MEKQNLLDIFDETEDIYLDGELNGFNLPEPKNHLLFNHNEISDIHKSVYNKWIYEKKKNDDMKIYVEKGDTFNFIIENKIESPLVLNFANPIIPGGGVRRGAKAQEEDLCRASNLLYALESEEVQGYYYRNKKYDNLGGNNAILSENISIIRHTNGKLLDRPIDVSVLTIAAPIVPKLYNRNNPIYKEKLEKRIETILDIAEFYNYKTLILGAWGCGAFNNNPEDVAKLFKIKLIDRYNFESVYFIIKADSERGINNYNIFSKELLN